MENLIVKVCYEIKSNYKKIGAFTTFILFILVFVPINILAQTPKTWGGPIKTYNGRYSTDYCVGEAQYDYYSNVDGRRIYGGKFYFSGKFKAGAIPLTGETIFDDELYQRIEKLRWENMKKYGGARMEIKGQYVDGLKNGKWVYVCKRYNNKTRKYIPTDSTLITYKDGFRTGECVYIGRDEYSGKIFKKEIVNIPIDSVLIYFYQNDQPIEYKSYYRLGKPSKTWKVQEKEFTIYFDFDNDETRYYNNQTGQYTRNRYISTENIHFVPFKHGFGYSTYSVYWSRIGGLTIGELQTDY